jgi:mRNA-degrading endonuclease RelE of RelBE toxin-antitoxin system
MAKILEFTERFKENYNNLPKRLQEIFDKKLSLFLNNPLHPSLNTHKYKIAGNKSIYEAYITSSYRFTFEMRKDRYIFRNIGSHKIIDRGYV